MPVKATEILAIHVQKALSHLYQLDVTLDSIQLQQTKKEFEGDYTLVTFPYTRASKKGPEQTAEDIGLYLKEHCKELQSYNIVKGFLNLLLTNDYWQDFLAQVMNTEHYGIKPSTKDSPLVLLEYSSPNTNKPLHLGHIRNHLLGYSVAEILKANGKRVSKTCIVNDRGVHICKSMLAWKKYGNGETPESAGIKGDHLVGKYYVMFERENQKEAFKNALNYANSEVSTSNTPDPALQNLLARLKNIQKINTDIKDFKSLVKEIVLMDKDEKTKEKHKEIFSDYFSLNTSLMNEAREMLQKWEAGDEETIKLWKTMNQWVYDGFDVTYKTIGIDFDSTYYESNTYLLGKDVVEEGLKKGVFFKKDDGSVWIDLTADGLDQKLVLRADGTSVYMTQDIGTAILRYKDNPDVKQMIYTVGNEQDYHFKVLFLILDKLGYSWAKECYHLSYGMVELPEGKMKSREGTVVDADDLLKEMYETAESTTKELGKIEDFDSEEAHYLYRTISLGALKYFMLKVDPKKKMLFNPKESIDFNGNTGPFIQYTYARIRSILRKAGYEHKPTTLAKTTLHEKEKEIIYQLHEFPNVVAEAGKTYSPALIANYVYELAKAFNQFYNVPELNIVREENAYAKNFRLALCYECSEVVKNSMKLLGINVPERM